MSCLYDCWRSIFGRAAPPPPEEISFYTYMYQNDEETGQEPQLLPQSKWNKHNFLLGGVRCYSQLA